MARKISTEWLVRCPRCQRNTKPWIVEKIQAFPNASPPIPARLQVRCAAKGCGERFYTVDRREVAA